MASLTLVSLTVNTGATVNLTGLGADDWAVWESTSTGTPTNRKSGGGSTLGATSSAGTGFTNDPNTFSWTDGTPTASNSETQGIFTTTNTVGVGNSSTWPASTSTRRAWLYGSYWSGSGSAGPKILAHLSDSSAADVSDTTTLPASAGSVIDFVAIFDYAAGSGSQTLTISQLAQDTLSINVDWCAAAVKVTSSSSTGVISSTGTATVTGSGSSIVSAAASSSASATVSGVGASTIAAVVSELGAGAVTGAGAAIAAGVVSELGAATVTGAGASTASGVVSELASASVLGVSGAVGASPADGLMAATSAVQATGASIASAAGSISASASINGTGAIIVSAAGQITAAATVKGSSTRSAARVNNGGPNPRRRIRRDEEAELLELAALLAPLISQGGPLWAH